MKIYSINSIYASGDDDSESYGEAATAEEALEIFKKGQSDETLQSWNFTASVINGVWAIEWHEKFDSN